MLIALGVCCGYLFQQLVIRKIIPVKADLLPLKKRIQQIIFFFLNPVAIAGATWVAKLEDINLITLPLLCLASLALGGISAYYLARLLGMGRKQTGSYICCGTFTNIGALGALFCFMFLGEAGFALVPIYKIFEEFCYFAYMFPLAKSFSIEKGEKISLRQRIKLVLLDRFVVISFSSIGLGLILNVLEFPRPEIYTTINAIIIPTMVFLLLFSIGLGMRFSSVGKYILPALSITAVKFFFVPLIITLLGYFFGLHKIDNGLPLKVVIILSAMPVGLLSVVPPTLYDLDVDLANSCWLVCNSLLIIQIPILLYIITTISL